MVWNAFIQAEEFLSTSQFRGSQPALAFLPDYALAQISHFVSDTGVFPEAGLFRIYKSYVLFSRIYRFVYQI